MHFSPKTLSILENFSQIHKSILFKSGKSIATLSTGKTIFGAAELDDEVEGEFAIYDLPRFLGVLRLFKDPAIAVGESTVVIEEGDRRAVIAHASPDLVGKTPNEPKLRTDVSFALTIAQLKDVRNAAAALGHAELAVEGGPGGLFIRTMNTDNPTSDVFSMQVAATKTAPFRMIVRIANLKVMPRDYDVRLTWSPIKAVSFFSPDVHYIVAVESSSVVPDAAAEEAAA